MQQVRAEHLRPFEHETHRTPGLFRRHRAQRHVRPRRTLATEATADKRRNHAHVARRHAEGSGDRLRRIAHALRRVVERELRAVPVRHRGVRLHRVVMLDRRCVNGIDVDCAAAHTVLEVAALRVRGAALRFVGRMSVRLRLREIEYRGAALISDAQLTRGIGSVFERIGDHHRDRLVVVVNLVVLQQRQSPACRRRQRGLAAVRQARRVLIRHHQQHAW